MYDIIRSIKKDISQFSSVRPYLAVIDGMSTIHYMDEDLESFREFITNFNDTSFGILGVGDHSLPIGRENLLFLKLSPKFLLIIYTKKGKIGELIRVKSKLNNYIQGIDNHIGDIDLSKAKSTTFAERVGKEDEKAKLKSKILSIYPSVNQDQIEKQKFPIDEARVLRLCNGETPIVEIMEKTGKTRIFINKIINKYKKKGFLKLVRKI